MSRDNVEAPKFDQTAFAWYWCGDLDEHGAITNLGLDVKMLSADAEYDYIANAHTLNCDATVIPQSLYQRLSHAEREFLPSFIWYDGLGLASPGSQWGMPNTVEALGVYLTRMFSRVRSWQDKGKFHRMAISLNYMRQLSPDYAFMALKTLFNASTEEL
jgi:hypothetical protein